MLLELPISLADIPTRAGSSTREPARAGQIVPVPAALAFSERAVATLRAAMAERGCGKYRIFHCVSFDLDDIHRHLAALGESSVWEPLPPSVPGGEALCTMTFRNSRATLWEVGVLHLRQSEVFIARWMWHERSDVWKLVLCAAPSSSHYERLRSRVIELRRLGAAPEWRIVGDYSDQTLPRGAVSADQLILAPVLRDRIEAEVVRFFSDEVRALYQQLAVPYRRGLLLHGPPGNGKTSLIRFIGAALPRVAAMLLRPSASFDSDDLKTVIESWTEAAPAILVIEDLDWLVERINVSTFLNLLDGIDTSTGGGLLLVATTNHPEKLDPAINNRPGRFDAVIEIPLPDEALRARFFAGSLAGASEAQHVAWSKQTHGLSFAHLGEIVRLSGLLAISGARNQRSDDDVQQAIDTVMSRCKEAEQGFVPKPEVPFGLRGLREHRQGR